MRRRWLAWLVTFAGMSALVWMSARAQDAPGAADTGESVLTFPKEWQPVELPAVDALLAQHLWSDPQAQCSALFSRAKKTPNDVAQVYAGLRVGLTMTGVELPTAVPALGERLPLAWTRPSRVGQWMLLGPTNETGHALFACYWSRREPEYCQAICDRAFDALLGAHAPK